VLPVLYAHWMLSVLPRAVHTDNLLQAGASISYAVIKMQHVTDYLIYGLLL